MDIFYIDFIASDETPSSPLGYLVDNMPSSFSVQYPENDYIEVRFTLPNNIPEAEGYKFLGWRDSSGILKGAIYQPGHSFALDVLAYDISGGAEFEFMGVWERESSPDDPITENKIYIKRNGSFVQGSIRYKHNNQWIVPTTVYVKYNGSWKPMT